MEDSKPRPPVSVVVVGYNEKNLVDACFRSLRGIAYPDLRVIYVDNTSPDGSLEYVREHFPEVVALSSGGNLGYCGGNNVGISRALADGAAFVLVLNPDTVVCNPSFVAELVDYMLAHPRVGKVGPKVYLRKHGDVQNTILAWPSILGSAVSRIGLAGRGSTTSKSATTTRPTRVPSLNGCCLLVRAEAFRDVGIYDAGFWTYVDEVDWDWQAERKGWERHYVPIESIVHLQKVAGYDFASRANFYMKRNTAMWYAKNGKLVSMTAWMSTTLLIAIARTVTAPFFGRSFKQYASFAGRLAGAYREVLAALVGGRLRRHHPVGGEVPGAAA